MKIIQNSPGTTLNGAKDSASEKEPNKILQNIKKKKKIIAKII